MIEIKVNAQEKTIEVKDNKSSFWIKYDYVDNIIKFNHIDLMKYFGLKPIKAFLKNDSFNVSVVFEEMFKNESSFKRYAEFITLLSEKIELGTEVRHLILDNFINHMKITSVDKNLVVVKLCDLLYRLEISISQDEFSIKNDNVHKYIGDLTKEAYDSNKYHILANYRVMDFTSHRAGTFELKFVKKLNTLLHSYFKEVIIPNLPIISTATIKPSDYKILLSNGKSITYSYSNSKHALFYSKSDVHNAFMGNKIPDNAFLNRFLDIEDFNDSNVALAYMYALNILWQKTFLDIHLSYTKTRTEYKLSSCNENLVIFYKNNSQIALSYDILYKNTDKAIVRYSKSDIITYFDLNLDSSDESYIDDYDELKDLLTEDDFIFITTRLNQYVINCDKARAVEKQEALPVYEIISAECSTPDYSGNKKIVVNYKTKLNNNNNITIMHLFKTEKSYKIGVSPHTLISLINEHPEMHHSLFTASTITVALSDIKNVCGNKYDKYLPIFESFVKDVYEKAKLNYFTDITPKAKTVKINIEIGSIPVIIIYDAPTKTYFIELEGVNVKESELESVIYFTDADVRLLRSIIKSLKIEDL